MCFQKKNLGSAGKKSTCVLIKNKAKLNKCIGVSKNVTQPLLLALQSTLAPLCFFGTMHGSELQL